MPSWILLVIAAQCINAIVSLIDRYIIVSGKIGRPVALAMYVSLLSALSIFVFLLGLLPLELGKFAIPTFAHVSSPTLSIIGLSLASAVSFIVALIALFQSFKLAQASDVVPVVSSVSAVASLLLSFYFLDAKLAPNFLWGFLFLVVGTFLVAHFRLTKKLVGLTIAAGTLFATHYVVLKVLFAETSFDNAFFWSRIVIAVTALGVLLCIRHQKKRARVHKTQRATKGGVALFLLNKALAGLAGILILKAIALGDVSIVQALTGLQFVFLTIFAIFLGHKAPVCVGENCEIKDKIQKIVSISIIVTGFVLLFI
jgi:drug/metabolite transporter (DMT)-like permease